MTCGLMLAAAIAGSGCNQPASPRGPAVSTAASADVCQAEPLAPFDCSIEGGMPGTLMRFSGQVTGIEAADAFGRVHFVVREASGAERRLTFQAPDGELPVQSGATYDFEIDRVGGSPTASGLIVRDAAGVLFAAASDQGIGDHVLTGGVPGITLGLVATDCPSRPHDACVEDIVNRTLQVTIAGQQAALHNGESARLGGYAVRCLIAQKVTYSGRCPDFALFGVSYTIARAK
jgi:hypothetical protein